MDDGWEKNFHFHVVCLIEALNFISWLAITWELFGYWNEIKWEMKFILLFGLQIGIKFKFKFGIGS